MPSASGESKKKAIRRGTVREASLGGKVLCPKRRRTSPSPRKEIGRDYLTNAKSEIAPFLRFEDIYKKEKQTTP